MAQNTRKKHCGQCGESGHSIRTCPDMKEVMFAIFRKRASKMLAELGALRRKEADLVKRAQTHIEESYQVIDTLYQEIDSAQLVIDEFVF